MVNISLRAWMLLGVVIVALTTYIGMIIGLWLNRERDRGKLKINKKIKSSDIKIKELQKTITRLENKLRKANNIFGVGWYKRYLKEEE